MQKFYSFRGEPVGEMNSINEWHNSTVAFSLWSHLQRWKILIAHLLCSLNHTSFLSHLLVFHLKTQQLTGPLPQGLVQDRRTLKTVRPHPQTRAPSDLGCAFSVLLRLGKPVSNKITRYSTVESHNFHKVSHSQQTNFIYSYHIIIILSHRRIWVQYM